MKDITKFASPTLIKPELACIYVSLRDEKRYAVATDTYRLAEEDITDLQVELPVGFYTVKQYKLLCKEINKKEPDFKKIAELFEEKELLISRYEKFTYPEYKNILPSPGKEMKPLTESMTTFKVNYKYLNEAMELIAGNHKEVELSDILVIELGEAKQIYIEKDGLKLLLMAMSNKK